MTQFFDFLGQIPPYSLTDDAARRLNQRKKLIIDPFLEDLQGAKVLDLAAHDGRWSYALAASGAASVTGIEVRPELVERFDRYPDTEFKDRVALRLGDIYEALIDMAAAGERFDVVAVYGIFYHIMDHFLLLRLIRRLGPKLVIIDSEFVEADNAMVQLVREDVSNELNAVSDVDAVQKTVIGIPSRRAMAFMAEALHFELSWVDKVGILGDDRRGMHDYFRKQRKVRSTCALRPL